MWSSTDTFVTTNFVGQLAAKICCWVATSSAGMSAPVVTVQGPYLSVSMPSAPGKRHDVPALRQVVHLGREVRRQEPGALPVAHEVAGERGPPRLVAVRPVRAFVTRVDQALDGAHLDIALGDGVFGQARQHRRVDRIGRAVQRFDANQPSVVWLTVRGGRHGCHPAHRYLALLVPIGELDHVPLVPFSGDGTGQNQQLPACGQHIRRFSLEGGRVAEAQPVGDHRRPCAVIQVGQAIRQLGLGRRLRGRRCSRVRSRRRGCLRCLQLGGCWAGCTHFWCAPPEQHHHQHRGGQRSQDHGDDKGNDEPPPRWVRGRWAGGSVDWRSVGGRTSCRHFQRTALR